MYIKHVIIFLSRRTNIQINSLMKKSIQLAVLASLITANVNAQTTDTTETTAVESATTTTVSNDDLIKKYMNTITEDDLRKHIFEIASDKYEGRETGERGQKLAADYISKFFFDNGFKGIVKDNPNPFLQSFDLYSKQYGDYSISTKDFTAENFKDFYPFGNLNLNETDVDLIFGGYGIETENYSDYKNLDVKGKGLVIIDSSPTDSKGNKIGGDIDLRKKIEIAKRKEAKFVVILFSEGSAFDAKLKMYKNYLSSPQLSFEEPKTGSFGLFFAPPATGAKLLGTTTKKFNKSIAKASKKGASPSNLFSNKVTVKAELKVNEVRTENVLGFIEGTDLKDEVLVVTSHYDHVGIINGEIHNGADDDASGSTGLLEIAEAFAKAAKDGHRPRRSILFMTFSGEEKGLLGSQYYTDNPIIPLENTVANLNIDMIGRTDEKHKDNPNFIYIIGSDMLSSELHELSKNTAKDFVPGITLDYTYNRKDSPERYYYRSDHYNFAKNNIPVIFYFNGSHEDYHQPSDTPDKILLEQQALRAKLVFATAWQIANRDKRLVVDKATENK